MPANPFCLWDRMVRGATHAAGASLCPHIQPRRRLTDPQVRSKMQGYTELWVTGSREILKVV